MRIVKKKNSISKLNKDLVSGMTDVFTTMQEAEERANELGGNGSHQHTYDGQEVFMPFESHDEYISAIENQKISKASYNDYPQSASNNAKRMIEWREKHGRDEVTAGTSVGWQRASSLAKREKLSESTIARMAQFNRHRENATIDPKFKDTPWKDNGYVAWNLWGGTSGVNWAIKKIKQIRNE